MEQKYKEVNILEAVKAAMYKYTFKLQNQTIMWQVPDFAHRFQLYRHMCIQLKDNNSFIVLI